MRLLPYLMLVTLIFGSADINAASSAKPKQNLNEKIDAKCFIEIVGGNEMIAFWSIKRGKLQTLSEKILGEKVHIAGKKSKGIVYKVHECKELSEKFSNFRAQNLDAKTPK